MKSETYSPSVDITGYVVDKPLEANYEVSVRGRGEDHWSVVLTGSYYRDRLGRTRKDIVPVLPGEQPVSVATVLDPVTKRILVFDGVRGAALVDRSDPDNPAFESVRHVAEFRPRSGRPEERTIEGYTCFALRSSRSKIWFCEELDEALIITEAAGDRETIYRLFDIITKDPDAGLFDLPGGRTD